LPLPLKKAKPKGKAKRQSQKAKPKGKAKRQSQKAKPKGKSQRQKKPKGYLIFSLL
jgi:hypothetical protein